MNIICDYNSIANQFIAELRSDEIQKDSMRFRRNMERLGEILAYEISKTLIYHTQTVRTPLGSIPIEMMPMQPVLATVLRAGLPFHQGFLNYFDKAESAFAGAYRTSEDPSFEIRMDYLSCPDINGKTLIIIDPMLATGKSVLKTYEALLHYGKPASLCIASVISSQKGIDFLKTNLPDHSMWSIAVDGQLNSQSYIIPGLGDAGDLSYGVKI
jgi:uracil phosphoribosyltransferase